MVSRTAQIQSTKPKLKFCDSGRGSKKGLTPFFDQSFCKNNSWFIMLKGLFSLSDDFISFIQRHLVCFQSGCRMIANKYFKSLLFIHMSISCKEMRSIIRSIIFDDSWLNFCLS